MLDPDVTIGMSLTGALTPAGLGGSCIVPLIKAGFVDWIVSTGANLYHDAHFAIGHSLHKGSPFVDDRILRKEGVIRIYDILFDYKVLLTTDEFFRYLISQPEFQKEMGTAEFHYRVGQIHFCPGKISRNKTQLGSRNSIQVRCTSLYFESGRQLDRHECGRNGARRLRVKIGCFKGRK